MPGFQFGETMQGTYTRDGVERPLSFKLDVKVGSVLRHLLDRTATLEGFIDAEGLADHALLTGTILIDPLLGRRIRYEFGFTGSDGESYRFGGQKNVELDPKRVLDSMTHLDAEITNERGDVVASARVNFDLRTIPAFARSFRLR